ncbi:CooT family nickel-binding protein [Desulfosarcina ovata]|uniref:RNA-binding protein n=2 Tax=Desulfosarcina ovata TaxID=83564 RepID=A0A5K8AIK1_9BACT|nr:CooT family nickel-binding protein [Desulfosarcina ovata]BBO82643.1 RNA-binding protein [Desulfosarcina ovata subsp. sediminis]BBO92388.1 RNA-binding protein [Desulfosarcina ovata subsp. ovata]
MCEANAYLITDGGETLVMEAVDEVSPEKDGLKLVNIFGEQKFLRAAVHSLSLVDHKVFLRELAP